MLFHPRCKVCALITQMSPGIHLALHLPCWGWEQRRIVSTEPVLSKGSQSSVPRAWETGRLQQLLELYFVLFLPVRYVWLFGVESSLNFKLVFQWQRSDTQNCPKQPTTPYLCFHNMRMPPGPQPPSCPGGSGHWDGWGSHALVPWALDPDRNTPLCTSSSKTCHPP